MPRLTPRNALREAQDQFAAGYVDEAATMLRRLRGAASARGRTDVVADCDEVIGEMQAVLDEREREAFDQLLSKGESVMTGRRQDGSSRA